MIRQWNPATLPAPASRYSHCALAENTTRRLEISGQVGVRPDGSIPATLAEQLDQAFANVDTALASAGMTRACLMKITVYLVTNSADAVATYRSRRDAWVGDATPPAATMLIVAGLAAPDLLCEVDAVAAD